MRPPVKTGAISAVEQGVTTQVVGLCGFSAGPVTDATILSTMVDGTVFVVRAFKTTKDLAKHAGSLLSEVGSRLAFI